MGRHNIFISTDPNAVIQVGTPGVSITIGALNQLIFAGQQTGVDAGMVTDAGVQLTMDDPNQPLTTDF